MSYIGQLCHFTFFDLNNERLIPSSIHRRRMEIFPMFIFFLLFLKGQIHPHAFEDDWLIRVTPSVCGLSNV